MKKEELYKLLKWYLEDIKSANADSNFFFNGATIEGFVAWLEDNINKTIPPPINNYEK
jgi:hypothetical protein